MKDACNLVCSFVRSGSRSFAPTVHSCLRRRAQTPSRSAVAQTTPQCPTSRGRTLDGGEHGGRLAWVGQKTIRRSGTAKLEPAMLSPPSQLCAHGCIVPSSRSGLLYNVREWERERPSNAVTAAPSNCVNGLISSWRSASSSSISAYSFSPSFRRSFTRASASKRSTCARLKESVGGPNISWKMVRASDRARSRTSTSSF